MERSLLFLLKLFLLGCVCFVLSGRAFAQYNQDYEKYELLFRTIEPTSTSYTLEGTFVEGDTIAITFSHQGEVGPSVYWLDYDGTKDIPKFITNSLNLWNANTARVELKVELEPGFWQLRIRTVGKESINWVNNYKYSEFSGRVDVKIEKGPEDQPARVFIILG